MTRGAAIRHSLEGKLTLLLALAILAAVLCGALAVRHVGQLWLGVVLALLIVLPLAVFALHRLHVSADRVIRAVADGMARLRDKDFSASLASSRGDEFGELIAVYNELGETMRDERQTLYQRELMLDTVIQATPLALVLTSSAGRILYANAAARQLFGLGRPLEGHRFESLLASAPETFRAAVADGQDGLFTAEIAGEDETFHLSRRRFTLNAEHHHLYLFKQLTHELNRQEVATWKKVIRVISHELNNSLAPMSSLAHSGKLIVHNPTPEKLELIFTTIEERADHLKRFIQGYARFAKLPQPRREPVVWEAFLEALHETVPFAISGEPPRQAGYFDPAQLEQVLINLLKNAHESGTAADDVELAVVEGVHGVRLHVLDRGAGMSEQVLQSALLPFYSTKRSGTGLGLPLSREIVEAHGGRLGLSNRDGGGLAVTICLPSGGDAGPTPGD